MDWGRDLWGWEKIDLWRLERMCENMWGCLDWGMIDEICEDTLLRFVSKVIVGKKFIIFFKGVKHKFTNLPMLLKIFK